MKIYKFKIIVEAFYVHPFYFLTTWKRNITHYIEYLKVRNLFIKLNWNDSEVWGLTSCCSSTEEAVETLCYKLTKKEYLYPKLRKLIWKGFERGWK